MKTKEDDNKKTKAENDNSKKTNEEEDKNRKDDDKVRKGHHIGTFPVRSYKLKQSLKTTP